MLLGGLSVEDCPFRVLREVKIKQFLEVLEKVKVECESSLPHKWMDGWMDGCISSIQGYRHINMCAFHKCTKMFIIYI